MKKSLFFLLALFLSVLSWQGTAQVTIGDGTATQRFPLGNWYGFERSAAIYTASEILSNGNINSVAWYATTEGQSARPIKIYLKQTTATTESTGTWASKISGATLVYDGLVTPVVGWNTFNLSTPFPYTSNNLEVLVEANFGGGGTGGSGGSAIRYSSKPNSHVNWSKDTSPPTTEPGSLNGNRPNIRLGLPAADGCSGTPNGGIATITPSSGGTNVDVVLSATGYSTGYTGLSFQWEYRFNQEPFINFGNPTSSYIDAAAVVTGPTGDMLDIRLKVTCTNSQQSAYSTIATYEFVPAYCTPKSTYTSDYLSSITSVGAVTNIAYSASSIPTDGYADRTSVPFQSYETQNFDINTTYVGGGNGVNIWVDWNNDMDFDETEKVASLANASASKTLSVTVPAGTPQGNYRMRIRSLFGSSANPAPCGSIGYGSAVDFNLNIVAPPPCLAPSELALTDSSSSSASFSWATPAANSDLYITLAGDPAPTPNSSPTMSGVSSPTTINGLDPNTAYSVYVRADCGNDGISAWSGALNFRTPCGSVESMFENFDSYDTGSTVPTCWTRLVPASSAGSMTISSTTPASGTRNIYQYAGSTSNPIIVVLPHFSNISDGTHWLRFKARVSSGAPGTLQVGYVTNDTDYSSFTVLENLNIINTSYTANSEYTVAVPNTVPNNARIAIKNMNDAKSYYWDDVYWEVAPTCLPPSHLAVNSVSSSSVDFSWTTTASTSDVYITLAGDPAPTPNSSPTVSNVTSPTTINGLDQDTAYSIYVRANCGSEGLSSWAGPLAAYTGYCISVPTSNDNNGITNVQVGNTDFVGSDDFYLDFLSEPAVDLAAGLNSNVQITFDTGYTYDTHIWIDLNDNLIFEPSELMFSGESTNARPTTLDASFMMPANAPMGNHRMRIGTADSGQATPNPCYSGGYGVTVDLNINVTAPPACLPSTALVVDAVSASSADVSWTAEGSESSWNISWGAPGYIVGQQDLGTGTAATDSFQINGLTQNTEYEFYVQSDCGNDLSPWSGPVSFRTVCSSTTVPYLMDFETATVPNLPACTSRENAGNGNNWVTATYSSGGFSGKTLKYGYHSSNPANAWFYTQGIELMAGVEYEISYRYGNNSTSWAESMRVAYGTSPSAAAMTTELADYPTIQQSGSTVEELSFTVPADGVYYFGFNAYSIADTFNLYLDDISITLAPLCTAPELIVEARDANGYPIEDCLNLNGEYYVYVSLYGGSGNTSYNVTANNGDPVEVVHNGFTTMGPFSQGTNVSVTAVGVQDEACSVTASLTSPAPCPPSNTSCDEAIALDCNADPMTFSSVGSTATSPSGCTIANNGIWFSFMGTGGDITINSSASFDHKMSMQTGSCGALTWIACKDSAISGGTETYTIASSVLNQMYYVYVAHWSSTSTVTGTITIDIDCAAPILCPAPTALTVGNITANSAEFNWTTTANLSDIYLVEAGQPAPDENSIPTEMGVTSPTTLNNLTHSTAYEVYVRADCAGNDGVSTWAGPVHFNTNCLPGSIPFNEGFESGYPENGNLAGCWSQQSISGSGNWVTKNVSDTYGRASRTGNGYISLIYGEDDWIFYPLTLTGGTSYDLSFYARQDATSGANVMAGFGTDNSAANMATIIPSTPVTSSTYEEFTGQFTPSIDGVYYIGIRGTTTYTPWYLTIDDISVVESEVVVVCESPLGIAVDNITEDSADITWSPANVGDDQWEISLTVGGQSADQGMIASVYGTSAYSATGLDPETTYSVYLRTVCADETTSDWVYNGEFTTLEAVVPVECESPLGIAVDNITEDSADITWSPANVGDDQWEISLTVGGQSADQGMIASVYGTSAYSATGLDPETTYSVYLRTVCADETTSDWAYNGEFTTLEAVVPVECESPLGIAVDNITEDSADITWSPANVGDDQWEISLTVGGQSADQGMIESVYGTSAYSATGLDPETTYSVYLRTVCADETTSDWAYNGEFTTLESSSIPASEYFVTTWTTTMANETITIPTTGGGYDYLVEWGDGSSDTGVTGNATHAYAEAGTYTVKIHGDFPRIYFNLYQDRQKIQSIEQWGNIQWSSMNSAFLGATNLVSNASDMPNLSMVTDMYGMFGYAEAFNGDSGIGSWDVSNVTNMHGMFGGAFSFDADISNWDVSNVTNMKLMFSHAYSFNQNIGGWDVGNVFNMDSMFRGTTVFDQDLGGWNVSNVVNMNNMFKGVTLSTINYDALLNGWSNLTLKNNVRFHAGNSTYCNGEMARQNIIATFNWTIIDGGLDCGGNGTRVEEDNNKTLADITLYPNPMRNKLILGNPKNVQLESASIYDLTGRLITTVDLRGMTSEKEMDVSVLSSATYMVIVNGQNGGQVSKLMVKE